MEDPDVYLWLSFWIRKFSKPQIWIHKKTILLKPDPFKKCNGKNHKTHAISGKRRKLFVTPLNAVMVLLMIMKSPTLQTSCPIKQSRTEHNKLNASLF